MSKSGRDTERRILEKALQLFNERGIEYVGLREIAATLGIRVSNITYYFPTKDHLVNRLSLELKKANARTVTTDPARDLSGFLRMFELAFQNQLRFRCLPLSFVHLMERNPMVAARYRKTGAERTGALREILLHLVSLGQLKALTKQEIEFLASALGFMARFWLSEASVTMRNAPAEQQVRHYIRMIALLLQPYATGSGRAQLKPFCRPHGRRP